MKRPWVRRSLAGLAALVVLVVLVTVVVRLELRPRPHQQTGRSQVTTPAAPTATPTASPAAQRLTPGTLLIPKIGVRAIIEQVTVDRNNDMAAPRKPVDVGWYSPGVAPGQNGDAVIDGHLDWYGMPKAVFYNLDQLQSGDEVDVISQSGVRLRFTVSGSTLVASTAHPAGLFAPTGPPRLTLITCAGDWDPSTGQYGKRLLVDATFAGVG